MNKYCLSCDRLSLAELLREENLAGDSSVTSCRRCKIPSLSVGICIDIEWELPLWPPDSILVKFPFINLFFFCFLFTYGE